MVLRRRLNCDLSSASSKASPAIRGAGCGGIARQDLWEAAESDLLVPAMTPTPGLVLGWSGEVAPRRFDAERSDPPTAPGVRVGESLLEAACLGAPSVAPAVRARSREITSQEGARVGLVRYTDTVQA